jgi:hypothetical protein
MLSWAKGVSSDGRFVVGGSNSSVGNEAYRWNAVDGAVELGQHEREDKIGMFAWDVSDDGSVVVGWAWDGLRPMAWTEQSGIQLLADVEGVALGVSGDGSTVGDQSVTAPDFEMAGIARNGCRPFAIVVPCGGTKSVSSATTSCPLSFTKPRFIRRYRWRNACRRFDTVRPNSDDKVRRLVHALAASNAAPSSRWAT